MTFRYCLFLGIALLTIAFPAAAQNYYYVDTLIGSDSLSGTTRAIDLVTQTGPKATIEGAIQAAPEGAISAIYLLSSSYTRDETGVVDAMGNTGGNDTDGISVQGNKTIHLILAHPEQVELSSNLEIDLSDGNSLQLRDDVTDIRTKTLLNGGFTLNSGSFVIDVGVGQETFLDGNSIVGEGTHLVVDDWLQMESGTLDIAEGAEVVFRDWIRVGETGVITNAGRIDADARIEYTWNGAFGTPIEESHTYLINEPTGVIHLKRPNALLGGLGITINRGIIRGDIGQFSNSTQIHGYFFNLGTVEVLSGSFRVSEVRTVLEEEEGGQILLVPNTRLSIDQAWMSPNSRLEGDGMVFLGACTFEGTIEFYGELTVSNCHVYRDGSTRALGR